MTRREDRRKMRGASLDDSLTDQAIESRQQQWLAESKEAIESFNRYVEEHGLPLARYRMF